MLHHNKQYNVRKGISKKNTEIFKKDFTLSKEFVSSSVEVSKKMKSGEIETFSEAEMNKMMDIWTK